MRAVIRIGLAISLVSASACSEDSRKCRAEFGRTQELVNGIKADSQDSLRAAVQGLDGAIAACERAGMGAEKSELQRARNEIGAHLDVLERRAARKRKERLTPEQLAELVAKGDPSCPKGQGYRSREAKKEIKCTGPQVIDMSRDAIKDYFAERNYKLTSSDSPSSLRAEYGAELYVFTFEGERVRCLEIYPAPGISWQELTSRMTGTPPEKLKPSGSIRGSSGPLDISVEDSDKKTVARIGRCK